MAKIAQYLDKVRKTQLETKLLILCFTSIFLPAYVSGVVCFFVALTFILRKNTRQMLLKGTGLWPIVLLCSIGIVSALLTRNLLGLAGAVFVMIPIFAVFFTQQGLITKENILTMFRLATALSLVEALIAFGQYFFIKDLLDRRPFAFFHNPNMYANIICIITVLGLGVIFTGYDKKFNALYLVTFAINMVALYLSGCRTVWPALACALLVMMLLLKKYKTAVSLAVLYLFMALCLYFDADLMPRLFFIEEDIHTRWDIIKVAFGAIKKRPVLGGGIFYFNMYSVDYVGNPLHRAYLHAHNLVINFAVDFGILGLGCITAFFILLFKKILKPGHITTEGAIAAGALMATLVHGLLDVTAFNVQTGQLFLSLMAMALASIRAKQGRVVTEISASK